MAKYFSLIAAADACDSPISDEQLFDVTDALGDAGCTDCSVMAHRDGLELAFHRQADSLEKAISTGIRDAKLAGLTILRVELNQEAIAETLPVAS
ncbi:MAG: hypothetical protein ISR77_23575 [Pirellulaceae bacterium]|nr:hypothetical protein [Pirellulaceae bacterium]